MESKREQTVIVLTRNYSTGLGVIRSLGAAGFPVDLIASVPKEGACEIAAASKYVNRYVEVVSKKVKEESDDPELMREIMQYAGQTDKKPILFPTDDYTTAVMDMHRSELAPYFLMPSVQSGADGDLARLMDKTVQAQMAKAVGLSVPKAWKVSVREENIEIPADMVYPCYCKPIRSIEGYKTEMAVCETAEELSEHLQLMRSHFYNRDVLVQEYLKIDQEIAIAGACLNDHVIIPAIIRKTRIGKHGTGVTLTGKMAPFEELGQDIPEKAFALLCSFGYHGTFGMEFNIVGDKVYFNEVNLRSAGESFAYYKCGVNLPLIFVKSLLGETDDPAPETVQSYGKSVVYDKIAWEDCIYGHLSKDELDECLRTADIKILCTDEDPRPGELFVQLNTEALEREERKRKAQQAKEECIAKTMQLTGWEREYAEQQIKDARERLGISYADYRKHEFGAIAVSEQAEAYRKILKNREHRKLQKECIAAAMLKNGWSEEYAREQLMDARERFGITYKDYKKYEFYAVPVKDQEALYKKIQAKNERIHKQKEECVAAVTESLHCSEEEALSLISDARERLGISYKDYKNCRLWTVPADEQKAAYEEFKTTVVKNNVEGSKGQTVVVLSRNYSTGLSVIRSLGSAGYTVDLVASAHKEGASEIAMASKYVRNAVEVVSKKVKGGKDTALVDALLKYVGTSDEKMVLFPTDDYTASVMDQSRSLLEDTFIMPSIKGGGDGSMTALMDKTVQGEMARKAGLLTPKEWIICLEQGVEIPADMVYPCFVKPIESITGYKTEMAKCDNYDELEAHLLKLRRKFASRSVLVQEFLQIDSEIDLGGVCLDQEIIIPAIIRKTNVAQYEKGVTLAGKLVPFEELGEIQQGVIDMLRLFGYTGMFDMELNIVGDKIYFNEVNLRSGGPNYSYFKSGVNLPVIFTEEAFGERHSEQEEKLDAYGKQFIYEKIAWEDHLHGFMSKKELNACIAAADITLLNSEDDPRPGEIFTRKIKREGLKRKLRAAKKAVKAALKATKNFVAPVLRPIKYTLLGYPQTKRANRRDPNSEKPRVLIIGRNYCSNLCMAKSVGEAGYEVEVMRIFQKRPHRLDIMKTLKPDAYSKYVKAYYVCITNRVSSRIVNKLIELADPNRKMLLIPTCDLTACIIDENYDELSKYYLMPCVEHEQGELSRLMSKGVQKELAKAAGLPVLNSCVVSRVNGEYVIPDSVTYPCFMKPNVSKNSAKSRMRKCDNRQELEQALAELPENKNLEMLVEDYVEIGKEYSLLGLSTENDGVIGPGFFVAEEGGQNEHRGVAVVGRMLPCEQQKKLIEELISFMQSLHYTGLYDIDLIETADGKMYFVEVNLRYGASGYALTKCGVNLPGMFADFMLSGKPLDMSCAITQPGKRFVSEKVLIEEYAKNRLSMDKMRGILNEVDISFVRSDDDPRPYRHFKKYYKVAGLMRIKNQAAEQ